MGYWDWPNLWTLFRVINELMLISRLEMTRRSVGGCLSRLSRDQPMLISDIGPHIIPGIASSDVARGPVPTPGNIRHLLTCSALSSHYAAWRPDSCLSNVSPLRLKYQFRKPISWHYHSPDELLLLFVVTAACPLQESAMLLSSFCLLLRAGSFGIILCFQQGLVFHADSHEH